MAASFSTTLRNARAQAIADELGNAAKLRIYTASYATLLSEHICGTPFEDTIAGGVLTANPIADDSSANATGDAAVARFYQSDGTTLVITGLTVGDNASSADVKLNQSGVTITSGGTVVIDSCVITEGNA